MALLKNRALAALKLNSWQEVWSSWEKNSFKDTLNYIYFYFILSILKCVFL